MPRLYFIDSNETIAQVSEEQLQFLADRLENEDLQDRDYYINRDTLEMLEEEGGDAELLACLKKALGDREEMDLGWEK